MSVEPEKAEAPAGWKRILGKAAKIFVITVVVVFLMGFIGVTVPIEIAFHLIAGPFIHAWKNLPPFVLQWRSALLPLGCLVVAIALVHRFICWWIKTKVTKISWRAGHSAAAALLILLGSAAAIAMSGITHQAAWLVSSPWLETNRKAHSIKAMYDARQIVLALFEYETKHEKFPETLEEAVKFTELSPSTLWIITGTGRPREPFIFLKPGRPSSELIEPVLVSPVIQTDKVVVGYSDASVRTMPLKAWLRRKEKIQADNE